MLENMQTFAFNLTDPDETAALAGSAGLFILPYDYTIVYVSVSPLEDDTGATVDIQDDTVDVITAIDASDHDVPGEWISTDMGGAETPVYVAAGSEIEFDINSAAAANRFDIMLVVKAGVSLG